jgi:DNA-binding NtrC family response regulator
MSTVLVVDDKEMLRDSVGATLQRAGFEVLSAPDATAALETIARRRPDAVVTDLRMPGMTGIELVERARDIDDTLPFVVMTAYGAVDTAVQAIKAGAFDYITKPFEGDELIVAIKRAIDHARLARENAVLRTNAEGPRTIASGGGPTGLARLIGDSPAMRRVRQQVLAVAESHGTVLICGESGTGKEVVARAVHEISPRAGEAFLAVNCAALSESLLESELFGHERGAFTGAEKLLQERSFERVGSSMTIGLDVRVIATSNRDLPRSVARGEFRQDLFFRLNVLPVHLPPLRDRLEDVPALVNHFLNLTAQREGKPPRRISEEAMMVLRSYTWPGNVREVQNVCERAAVLCKGEVIERSMIEPWLLAADAMTGTGLEVKVVTGNGVPMLPAPSSEGGLIACDGRQLEDIERDAIIRTLNKFNGHRQRTAQSLGIGVRTLGLKLKKWKQQQLVEQTL